MLIQIFAVYDAKAKSYLQPFFLHNKETAIRSFTDAVNNPETQFHKHPLDYTLFQIGEYDDEKASLETPTAPQMLTGASQLLQGKTKNEE